MRVGLGDLQLETPRVLRGNGEYGTSVGLGRADVFDVVLIGGGDLIDWSYAVEGGPWKEVTRGNEVISLDAGDFRPLGGDASVMAVQAHATLNASVRVVIEHELIGSAGGNAFIPFFGVRGLSVEGPSGVEECSCYWPPNVPNPPRQGPGVYEFRWTDVGVRVLHAPVVVAADVPGLGAPFP